MATKVYANKATKKAHSATKNDRCRQSALKQSNVVKFEDLTSAKAAGYKLCGHCFPGGQQPDTLGE